MPALIEIRDLQKWFGRLAVLREINVAADRGRVTAIVGHNGSGKTTLLKSVLGLVKPDGGTISFDGEVLNGSSLYRDRIGYMAQSARFPENLTATDLLEILIDLRGRPAPRRDALIERFGLEPELDKPIRTLSGGTRQKVSAVSAFMFDPEVLILDEPTAGLDPVASSALKDLVALDKARGRTFILTSHVMTEIEELADFVVFLQDGKARYLGDVADLRLATGARNLERAIANMMLEDAVCIR